MIIRVHSPVGFNVNSLLLVIRLRLVQLVRHDPAEIILLIVTVRHLSHPTFTPHSCLHAQRISTERVTRNMTIARFEVTDTQSCTAFSTGRKAYIYVKHALTRSTEPYLSDEPAD